MSRAQAARDGLVDTLRTVAPGSVTICGESHTYTHTLAGDVVQIGTDPADADGLRVAVHMGRKTRVPDGLGAFLVTQELHVFGVAPAAGDDEPEDRENAALALEDDCTVAITADRNDGVRIGSITNLNNITVQSAAMDGGAEFEGCGAMYMLVSVTWASYTGA